MIRQIRGVEFGKVDICAWQVGRTTFHNSGALGRLNPNSVHQEEAWYSLGSEAWLMREAGLPFTGWAQATRTLEKFSLDTGSRETA
jgi:hypothetical protein